MSSTLSRIFATRAWLTARKRSSSFCVRQPGANIIEAVDSVKAELPHLAAAMPSDMEIALAADRSTSIRASLHDTELSLVIAVALVTLIVFAFLRDFRMTLIPSIAVPISILGTFGAMYP